MSFLALDLGGTKLAYALVSDKGAVFDGQAILLGNRKGPEIAGLIKTVITDFLKNPKNKVDAIGISVPGIYNEKTGRVWAPNLTGWDDFPLLKEVEAAARRRPVVIQSDRACYINGEVWKGAAKGCRDAVFIAVGTGIGMGILSGGKVINGSSGVAGAAGWMAVDRPYQPVYKKYGCLESRASGDGIARLAKQLIKAQPGYAGVLRNKKNFTAADVFDAYHKKDELAKETLQECIKLWGMMVANMVSLLNPERIIFGGGVFGPAKEFIPQIIKEAARWAQPVSMKQVSVTASEIGSQAGLLGAAFFAKELFEKSSGKQ